MNFNQYTKKSLEAVQSAQSLAVEHHHQQMEQLHLLLALLQQEGGLAPQILRKLGVTVESLEAAAQAELDKLPRVSGSREADKFYISQGVDDVLQLAERLAASMKDEYVSVEHLLLALVEAAQVDGANHFQVFWRVKWAQMMPTTLYILVITTINSFQCFALIQLLTQGGSDTNTVMFYIYWTAFKLTEQAGHFGYANAMGVVLAIFIGLLSAVQFRLAKEK